MVDLNNAMWLESIFRTHNGRQNDRQRVYLPSENAAKLLMTPMRDATNTGPNLRDAHRLTGQFLTIGLVADIIGLEEHDIKHVQPGTQATGHRFRDEKYTIIVPCMRGGEPMAFGVNEAMPTAMFVHAEEPEDLKPHHLYGQHTVILVDSVVNSGKSIIEFVRYIRTLDATIRIIVVAGVVQIKALTEGLFAKLLTRDVNFHLVALRTSENKFTGQKTTDTGNRLFNTTHLD